MTEFYKNIRKENFESLEEDVSRFTEIILSELYADRTHFLYELLQNAEDACGRRKSIEGGRDYHVNFQLFSDRLEVRHNGIPFDREDIKGICRIVASTKTHDLSQIGKFGIGFKSIYAFTKNPRIYSQDKTFLIEAYIRPVEIPPRGDVSDEETLIVIPFDHDQITPSQAYSKIEKSLENIEIRTLLFLKHIQEISWNTNSHRGSVSRMMRTLKQEKLITLIHKHNEVEKEENWLIFKKPIKFDSKVQTWVEIAYLVGIDEDTKKKTIKAALNTHLFVYFQTEKDPHLHFLIQGHYRTTPSRDNIKKDDKWNLRLIAETASLVAESISKIKDLALLNVEFLNTLPINYEHFLEEETMFKPIFDAVRDEFLTGKELLPAYKSGYVSVDRALLARSNELRKLLDSPQLEILFEREDTRWLDEKITEDREPNLRKYLMKQLNVEEIPPRRFARAFTGDFIKIQEDAWIILFYDFLSDQKRIFETFKSKPIIRLEKREKNGQFNCHTEPFDSNNNKLAYFPSKDKQINKKFPIIKRNILKSPQAFEFLKKLGLKEPNAVSALFRHVLPKYHANSAEVDEELNLTHIEWILNTFKNKNITTEERDRLLEDIKGVPFLYARNIATSKKKYTNPSNVYIGGQYTDVFDIEVYFEGNANFWILDERYKSIVSIVDFLVEIGCKIEVQVKFREVEWDGHVYLSSYSQNHRRGRDGFDPSCKIEGLGHALSTITLEKALIIWNIIKNHYMRIQGIIERASRQDYKFSQKDETFSIMGDLLLQYPWLPDSSRTFHKPSEMFLSSLNDAFEKESPISKSIAERLCFRKETSQEIIDNLPTNLQEVCLELKDVSKTDFKRILEMIRTYKQKMVHKTLMSPKEIRNKVVESLERIDEDNDQPKKFNEYSGLTPEEEDTILEQYGRDVVNLLAKDEITKVTRTVVKSTVESVIDPKEFLFEQYKGHCQICNTLLDLGKSRRPWFNIFRMFETRGTYAWTNMEFNILCLCPNCHVLLKEGSKNLKNLIGFSQKCAKREIAPESVGERGGDFYIIPIEVVGKEANLFYSPNHMNKFSAFISQEDS